MVLNAATFTRILSGSVLAGLANFPINPDGSLSHYVNLSVNMEARTSMSVTLRLIGPDGEEIVGDKGPTEDQIVLQLARDNEPFRRAQVLYGSLEHTWANLRSL